MYQRDQEYWIVYTNYISSLYSYGLSTKVTDIFYNNPREVDYYLGAMRSLYVDLYRKIKDEDHKDEEGEFLKVAYDIGMQMPLLEMAGKERSMYLNEITYYYNFY